MFFKKIVITAFTIAGLLLVGCQNEAVQEEVETELRVGIMLSDVGLGDQSFSDAAFNGLIRAREELGIMFDYRELEAAGSYEQGLTELVNEDFDLIIGLGFMVKDALEETADKHPDQQFLLIDDMSDKENIASVSFKEHEGSFLAGAAAAMASKSGVIGFVGGADVPLINKFAAGYEQGARYVQEDIEVLIEFANDFGAPEIGTTLASRMIDQDADVLYAAAGLTGVGVLQTAQERGVLSIGVDSDQYVIAEDSVMTSMMKFIDQAVYQSVVAYADQHLDEEVVFGLAEAGVGLAPFRLVNEEAYISKIEEINEAIINGEVVISEMREGAQ
ncbi:BMP family lipoprotein [Alkalihalophilus marmarensis]|uniref:BMP family lipoprotein n=1 Tax=Alkalihalophilus marmarensis TaxID=521377 RepID=UPI002DB9422F|nr:BMP family ABC transporter substrate-binding protein [Alkalihalophilus marmarensis]MEC2071108.1 BMP family ABC transporter substrate-binding protein [Alkalihalophilus marmarensis]